MGSDQLESNGIFLAEEFLDEILIVNEGGRFPLSVGIDIKRKKQGVHHSLFEFPDKQFLPGNFCL